MSMKSVPNTGVKYSTNSAREVARRVFVAQVVVAAVEAPKKTARKRAAPKKVLVQDNVLPVAA